MDLKDSRRRKIKIDPLTPAEEWGLCVIAVDEAAYAIDALRQFRVQDYFLNDAPDKFAVAIDKDKTMCWNILKHLENAGIINEVGFAAIMAYLDKISVADYEHWVKRKNKDANE